MCFELSKPPLCNLSLSAYYYRNDYMGVEQYSRYRDSENYVFLPGLYEQHEKFAKLWDRNLRDQDFSKPSRTSQFAASPFRTPSLFNLSKEL